MRTLSEQLTRYATYHRDRRNLMTHFIGIPTIVLAVAILLSRPTVEVAGLPLSPAVVAIALTSAYYLRLELMLGLLMTTLMVAAGLAGVWFAALPTPGWLGWGAGLFVFGWAFQFVGHVWEGRKPAFVDDVTGLIIGPLFIVAELLFAMGLRKELQATIEHEARPRSDRPQARAPSA